MAKINSFKKSALPQNRILGLCKKVYRVTYRANRSELSAILVVLKAKIDKFDGLIHPIMGSELTPELKVCDINRDNYLVGFRHGIEFNARHYDPLKVAAAKEIMVVLSNASYKKVYKEEQMQETDTIENLVDELQQNHAAALTTLGLTEYVQKLAEANTAFDDMLDERTNKRVRDYNYLDIKTARSEMEHAFDVLRDQLNIYAEMEEIAAAGTGTPTGGTGTPTGGVGSPISYKDLVIRINDYIAIATKDSPDYDDEEDDDNTNTTPENNDENIGGENGGENNGEENTNTDNGGFGDENTPSANA